MGEGVGTGLHMYDVVVKNSSCSLSHLLISSCVIFVFTCSMFQTKTSL